MITKMEQYGTQMYHWTIITRNENDSKSFVLKGYKR